MWLTTCATDADSTVAELQRAMIFKESSALADAVTSLAPIAGCGIGVDHVWNSDFDGTGLKALLEHSKTTLVTIDAKTLKADLQRTENASSRSATILEIFGIHKAQHKDKFDQAQMVIMRTRCNVGEAVLIGLFSKHCLNPIKLKGTSRAQAAKGEATWWPLVHPILKESATATIKGTFKMA